MPVACANFGIGTLVRGREHGRYQHRTSEPADRAREADNPHSPVVRFGIDKPLRLDAGIDLAPFQIAYQTYGTLNRERSNAVLICHALTGDQHVANLHPVTQKPGWWETMVGPGGRSIPSAFT